MMIDDIPQSMAQFCFFDLHSFLDFHEIHLMRKKLDQNLFHATFKASIQKMSLMSLRRLHHMFQNVK